MELVCKGEVPTGVNLNRYPSSKSWIPWHSDNESLFGPSNQPKLIVSVSLGHSVVFQVRRAPGNVPSSITLDHGDLLVMDGSAQSEYAQPYIPLGYAMEGVVGCVLPTCVQGAAEPGSRGLGIGENKWSSFWGLVLLFLILVGGIVTVVGVHPARRCTSLSGSCSLGRGTALATVTTPPISRGSVFLFPLSIFFVEKLCFFMRGMVLFYLILLDMLLAEREQTPCNHDAHSIGYSKRAFWGKSGQNHCKTTVSTLFGRFFSG